MARGIGTSLGVGLTGLVFTLLSANAGHTEQLTENASLARGFAGAMVFLAMAALVAALLTIFGTSLDR